MACPKAIRWTARHGLDGHRRIVLLLWIHVEGVRLFALLMSHHVWLGFSDGTTLVGLAALVAYRCLVHRVASLFCRPGAPFSFRLKGEHLMEVHTLGYDRKKFWSVKSRPRIDSRRTLVLLFGSSSLLDSADPLGELINDYPESIVIGCSTAGKF